MVGEITMSVSNMGLKYIFGTKGFVAFFTNDYVVVSMNSIFMEVKPMPACTQNVRSQNKLEDS